MENYPYLFQKLNSQNDTCCKITRKVESVSVSGRRSYTSRKTRDEDKGESYRLWTNSPVEQGSCSTLSPLGSTPVASIAVKFVDSKTVVKKIGRKLLKSS